MEAAPETTDAAEPAKPVNAADAPEVFIDAVDIHKQLGEQKVLQGVNLQVFRGETLVLIGGSGGGKSVLLKHLIGLTNPDRGQIFVEGQDIAGLNERQLGKVRMGMGYMFQSGALFDSLTVEENVAFPLRRQGMKNMADLTKRVADSLDVVELTEHAQKMPVDISGGMRKRVALARAIITRPKCIFYDEPTAGLDPIVTDIIDHLILRMQKRFQITSIVVTHDMKSVYHIANRVAYLKEGKIYFLGTPEELKASTDPVITDFTEGRSGMKI